MSKRRRENIQAALTLLAALALFIIVPLLLKSGMAHGAEYEQEIMRGFGRFADSEVVKVPLYSFYASDNVQIDTVRLPKPPEGYTAQACLRAAPSNVARCLYRMELMGLVIVREVSLNLREV